VGMDLSRSNFVPTMSDFPGPTSVLRLPPENLLRSSRGAPRSPPVWQWTSLDALRGVGPNEAAGISVELRMFTDHVSQYSKRVLAYEEDGLNALRGVLSRIS
jgi:hypothetical protein